MTPKQLFSLLASRYDDSVDDISDIGQGNFLIEEYEHNRTYVLFAILSGTMFVLRSTCHFNTDEDKGLDVGTWWKTYFVEDISEAYYPKVEERNIDRLMKKAEKLLV